MVDLEGDKIENWWKQQLNQLVLVNLPVDYSQQESPSQGYGHWRQYFDELLTVTVLKFIENQQLKPIVFYDAICRVLFYRYSQQSDITWLITLNDANFVNKSLVSRFNCDGQSDFVLLCQQLQSFYNQLFENNCKLLSIPIDKIAKSLEPKSLNVHLIASINSDYHEDDNINVKSKNENDLIDDFHLVIQFNLDESNCLSIDYKYKVDFFKNSTIQRLSSHFINLINSLVVNNLNSKLDDHELLNDDEREQLENFNPDYPPTMQSERFFIEMFYQSVDANAYLMAIKEQSRDINYQQLNQKSNQLAHYLAEVHNVQPGDMIAIMLPQGIDNFIAILATLKLGSAFVPLGIDYPVDRIQFILTDCDEPILITQDKLSTSIGYNKVLYYSDIDKELSSQSGDNLPLISTRDDLAYCMYTSGSTGQPKGVLISQRTISFMATSLTNIFNVSRETRSSLISATAFDAAICESFPTLVQGGLLVLPDQENRYNHHYLVDWLINEQINYCYLPAKIMDLIFEYDLHEKFSHPIKMWASGEPLGAVKVTQESNIEVYNVLGMTELTPLTYVRVNSLRSRQDLIKPPVGSPVPGVKVYITDSAGRLCPIGVVGEITYSSPLIAQGYHKLPEQTAEKFKSDPYNGHLIEGSRLLKSGDLARWREDGLIEFFGRADDQVKVRGYRIELSEIEKLLNNFQGVHQSTVLVKKGKRADDSRIVAFMILTDEENKSQILEQSKSWRKNFGSALHSYLRSHLPYFMLPQVFVVSQFPLNSNGKIDKKGLISLNCDPLMSSTFHEPMTQMQRDMIKIWSQVLTIPVESLGIDDNFFELGGHSLLAVRIVGQLNQPPFNYPVTTRMILTLATVRSICDLIETDSLSNVTIKPIPIIKSRTGIDLGIAQSWLAMFELSSNGQGVTNEFFYFTFPSKLTWEQVNGAINCLIERHEAFRLTLSKNQNNKIRQSAEPFKPITIPIFTDFSSLIQIYNHFNQFKSSIFDIFNGSRSLVKFAFIQFNSTRLITMAASHIALDGISFQLIDEELKLMFKCLESGIELNLPPVKTDFLDYVDWENRTFYSDSKIMDQAKAFWINRLKGFKAARLPLTIDPILCIGDEGLEVCLYFDDEVTKRIEIILKEYQTTLFVFTQAVLLSILHLHTGSTDITTYIATRNVNHHSAIPLIGNLAVVNFSRVSWTPDDSVTFVDLLRTTHDSVMKEHEFRFFPVHKLFGVTSLDDADDTDDDGFIELVPITITQAPDREEAVEFLKKFRANSLVLNALVINFMKIESKYSIDFLYAKHGFESKMIQYFVNAVQLFVQRVSLNPIRPLGKYLADPDPIEIIKW